MGLHQREPAAGIRVLLDHVMQVGGLAAATNPDQVNEALLAGSLRETHLLSSVDINADDGAMRHTHGISFRGKGVRR